MLSEGWIAMEHTRYFTTFLMLSSLSTMLFRLSWYLDNITETATQEEKEEQGNTQLYLLSSDYLLMSLVSFSVPWASTYRQKGSIRIRVPATSHYPKITHYN